MIVLRHFQAGSSATAASVSSIPIINAGDGPGQHPTQVTLSQTLLAECSLSLSSGLDRGHKHLISVTGILPRRHMGDKILFASWSHNTDFAAPSSIAPRHKPLPALYIGMMLPLHWYALASPRLQDIVATVVQCHALCAGFAGCVYNTAGAGKARQPQDRPGGGPGQWQDSQVSSLPALHVQRHQILLCRTRCGTDAGMSTP